ncbi:MAG: toxin-antitoxin system YwqK family antitoxin [Polyangiaceae bacterium]
MRTTVAVSLAALVPVVAGCNPYTSTSASVNDPSDIALDDYGAPVTGNGPIPCPPASNDGAIQFSWDSGAMKVKGTCQAGLRVGTWKGGYANGEDRWKAEFTEGVINGTFKAWYPDGELRVKMEFLNNVPNGTFKAYWPNGETREKGEFVNGKRNGCWYTYYENGKDHTKGTYADDDKVLSWFTWSEDGTRKRDKYGGKALHGECLLML